MSNTSPMGQDPITPQEEKHGAGTTRSLTARQADTIIQTMRREADYLSAEPTGITREAVADIREVADFVERTRGIPADDRMRRVVASTLADRGMQYPGPHMPEHMVDVLRDLKRATRAEQNPTAEAARPAYDPSYSTPPSSLDADYRVHLVEPDRMVNLAAGDDGEPTLGEWKREYYYSAEDRVATRLEQGVPPQLVYVEERRRGADGLECALRAALEKAELLSDQGVSRDTLDRHLVALVDAHDAVQANVKQQVFASTVDPVDTQRDRIAELREQGVSDSTIATHMRAQASYYPGGLEAARVPVAPPSSPSPAAQQYVVAEAVVPSRIARLTARVIGRGEAQGR